MSKKRPKSNKTEAKMVSALDKLAEFEEFQAEILPALRKALKSGQNAEDIYKMVHAHAAARAATFALTERDPAKAKAYIEDILNRTGGKPTERREVSHKLEKLPDDQLDAILMSKLGDLEDTESDETH